MKTTLLTAVLLSCPVLAQATEPTKPQPPAARKQGASAAASAEKWVGQLGSDSYRDRLQAENELRKLGEAARPALQRAAGDDRDSEVQWRAKRLLRQFGAPAGEGAQEPAPQRGGLVERGKRGAGDRAAPEVVDQGRAPRAGGVDDMRAEFDRIFKRFEEMGLDVPSRRFFDDPFFRDLESQFGRGLGLPGMGSGQGMSVQIGPDGVRVEVAEQGEDGKSETKVYEAPDMETFQEKYPGVLKGNGLKLGFGDLDEQMETLRGRIGKLERGFDWDLAEPRVLRLPKPGLGVVPPPVPPAPGRRLGVTVKSIPDVLREYLELGDAGLMVETVQDDSLAAACGLRADDIVVKIGDREIASPADVAAALGAIKKGDEVRVDFVRRGSKETAKTAKRFDAEALERQPALRKREKLR